MRFKAGEPWHLETPKLEALATAEQAARFVVDAWEEQIREWLGDRNDVSIGEVLTHALGLEPAKVTQSNQNRAASILTHLGFTIYRPSRKKGKGRQRRYQRVARKTP